MAKVSRREALGVLGAIACTISLPLSAQAPQQRTQSWPLKAPRRTGIHDVAPAPDGGVWFTAQASGHLGYFEPKSGKTELVDLGMNSAPHGVIQGPDKAAWITDGGQQSIVRVGWPDREVRRFALPYASPYANLNTCAFDGDGNLWFTGQSGVVGRVIVKSGKVDAWDSPRGRGPYGICATPTGDIWWCSLAGSFIAKVDRATGESAIFEPPTRDQGARRVWSDSHGRIWVSEWNSGNVSMYDPAEKKWGTHKLPVDGAHTYAVYVDDRDQVWTSEWTSNSLFRLDPSSERFERFPMQRSGANVRQILGRPGEVWLPESGTEHITVVRTG
jgi:virginiamycin B lyase